MAIKAPFGFGGWVCAMVISREVSVTDGGIVSRLEIHSKRIMRPLYLPSGKNMVAFLIDIHSSCIQRLQF